MYEKNKVINGDIILKKQNGKYKRGLTPKVAV